MYFESTTDGASFSWGYEEKIEQKKAGVHVFEKIACNMLDVDENFYLPDVAVSKLADQMMNFLGAHLPNNVNYQMNFKDSSENIFLENIDNHIDLIAEKVLKKMIQTPDDPLVRSVIESIRTKTVKRIEDIIKEPEKEDWEDVTF